MLATEIQSAPASSTASAISTMLPTFGESFTISGRVVTARQARVTAAAELGIVGEQAPAVADIRAGDVHFEAGDARYPVERRG